VVEEDIGSALIRLDEAEAPVHDDTNDGSCCHAWHSFLSAAGVSLKEERHAGY
jgi:hypothetical protein